MSGHPTWTQRYRLGVELAKQLEPVATYEEIGAELGVTKQNAYTECVLALGKVAFLAREQFGRGFGSGPPNLSQGAASGATSGPSR